MELGYFVVVLGVWVWVGNSWVLSEEGSRMIFGYRSGFCCVWVEWNYYADTAKHFSTLKCKHTPSYYKLYFQCAFCNKNKHWTQVEFLTVIKSSQSSRKWYKRFVFAVRCRLIKCICSKYKCISMTYSYSFACVISFWYQNLFNTVN